MIMNSKNNERLLNYSFASIYKLYVQKVERKGKTASEVNTVLKWLTGYDDAGLEEAINDERTLEAFFQQAPALNPNTSKITGVICGYRVEDIQEPMVQKIRWMDKLVDEVAKGKKMEKILRA